jgi:methionyl-tRNA synthetase
LQAGLRRITEHYEAMEFRKAANETRALWAAGNEYLTRAEPWVKDKSDVDAAAVGVRTGLNLVAIFAIIAQPLIPNTAKTILDTLGIPDEHRKWPSPDDGELLNALPHGMPITAPPVLFQKIEDAMVDDWTTRFGGEESA